jgi:hypothetical protein
VSRRRLIQVVFVLIGLLWLGFVFVDFLGSRLGDCVDEDPLCEGYKRAQGGLTFWRGLAVTLIIFVAYRIFREEREE